MFSRENRVRRPALDGHGSNFECRGNAQKPACSVPPDVRPCCSSPSKGWFAEHVHKATSNSLPSQQTTLNARLQ